MLPETCELALAGGLGILHNLPIVVLPGPVLPIGAAGAHGDVLAAAGEMLVAVETEPFAVPDIANRLRVDVAHAGNGGNVVPAYHHVSARIDVQPLEDERARHLVGVEIDRK